MSKKCEYNRECKCDRSYGYDTKSKCGGFDPCKVALFLLVLFRAGIISPNTGIILVLLFLLCCGGTSCGSLCGGC